MHDKIESSRCEHTKHQEHAERVEKLGKLKETVSRKKEEVKNKVKSFLEKKMTDPEIQKKVLIAAAVSDILSGVNSAREIQRRKQEVTLPSDTSIVSQETEEQGSKKGLEELLVIAGCAIHEIGSNEENMLSYIEEHKEKGQQEKSFEDKIREIEPEPIKDKATADSFLDGKYKTVEATEDIVAYRVYGGGSEKEGDPRNENIFLTTREPQDRMEEKTDLALSNRWQGEIKNEDGTTKTDNEGKPLKSRPNTREFYCEVYIPKGTHMNIGRAAPQETKGGQLLQGGGEQIVVKKGLVSFGEEREVNYWGNYDEFERKAQEIENEK